MIYFRLANERGLVDSGLIYQFNWLKVI